MPLKSTTPINPIEHTPTVEDMSTSNTNPTSPAQQEEAKPKPSHPRLKLILSYLAAVPLLGVGQVLGIFISTFVAVFCLKATGSMPDMPVAQIVDTVVRGRASTLFEGYQVSGFAAWVTAAAYLSFIGIWIVVCLWLYLIKSNRPILTTLTPKTKGNTLGRLGFGLALGFGLNAACVGVAVATGAFKLSFVGLNVGALIGIFVCVFIQSSAEELLCRCYLLQKTYRAFGSYIPAVLLNALFFTVLHLMNPGITVLSVLNLFVVGVMFGLLVYRLDSPWAAFGAHAAWNFTQNILFGLPNSGQTVPFAVFGITPGSTPVSNFAYNTGFGIEGSALALVLLLATCFALWRWGDKGGATPTRIWPEDQKSPSHAA